jgi:hypothetical protein
MRGGVFGSLLPTDIFSSMLAYPPLMDAQDTTKTADLLKPLRHREEHSQISTKALLIA